MLKLSYWAKDHRYAARILVVIIHCLLIWMGWNAAEIFYGSQIHVSPVWLPLFAFIFLGIAFIYPARKEKRYISSFKKRKLLDFLSGLCGFILVFLLMAQLNQGTGFGNAAMGIEPVKPSAYKNPAAEKLITAYKLGEKTSFTRREKRVLKNEFKYQLGQYAKSTLRGNKTNTDETGVIILTIIAAVGLLYVLAAISCSLSCNGSDGAAVVVLLVGIAAIVWGIIAVIKGIHRREKSRETLNEHPN
jgi:uncharacterized membrane protein HdeD (DUF308 family)